VWFIPVGYANALWEGSAFFDSIPPSEAGWRELSAGQESAVFLC